MLLHPPQEAPPLSSLQINPLHVPMMPWVGKVEAGQEGAGEGEGMGPEEKSPVF
uniref:Uncharacterized protein n=1 Tax=Anguilla anguilla TaxID=7936 RepID=A0A0E9VE80_ANGAN